MTAKLKGRRPPDDPAQSRRFIDMAKEVEVDESPEAFDRAFRKVVGSGVDNHKSGRRRPEKRG